MKKAGRKADSEQSIENRRCYETEEEKRKFISESFQAVIKLFLVNFEVLVTHPSQYGETKVSAKAVIKLF